MMTSVSTAEQRREAVARRLYDLGHLPWACTIPQLERDERAALRMALQAPDQYSWKTVRSIVRAGLNYFRRPHGLQLLIGGPRHVVVIHVTVSAPPDLKVPYTPAKLITGAGHYSFFAHPGVDIFTVGEVPVGVRILGAYGDYTNVHVPEDAFAQIENWPAVDDLPVYDPSWLEEA